MDNQRNYVLKANKVPYIVTIVLLMLSIAGSVNAKSLYVLVADWSVRLQPIRAYDIDADGKLTFQSQYNTLPWYKVGATKVTMDSDSGYLFVTYRQTNKIAIVDSKTMDPVGTFIGDGAINFSGIAYDHTKKLLYCTDRSRPYVFVYNWNADTKTLTPASNSPYKLKYSYSNEIALDDVDGILYVTNTGSNKIHAYSTSNWSLLDTITLSRVVSTISIDIKNGYLYAGAADIGNPYLTQYHLASNTELETLVESTASEGILDISVDPNSSRVYLIGGAEGQMGKIRIFSKLLHPLGQVVTSADHVGLIVPGKELGYNPLELKKTVVKIVDGDSSAQKDSADAGDLVTYRICFSNTENDYTVTDVSVIDNLPEEVTFVSASDDGVFGEYKPAEHSYQWLYPTLLTGSTACLDITVKINNNVSPRTTIINSATVNSNTTPQSSTVAELVTATNPLNIKKTVSGGIDGQTKWVDSNDVVTYNIYFDNMGNDFTATNVSVIDTLPDEVVFLEADDKEFPGLYDPNTHIYIWSGFSLAPKSAANLAITVKFKEGIQLGTIVTNDVMIQCDQTATSTSSASVRVGEGPLVIDTIQLSPSTLRRNGSATGIMAILEMPVGYKVDEVKNTPLVLSLEDDDNAMTVPANDDQVVVESRGKTYVIAVFDKNRVMDAIEGYGTKKIQITGTLSNGGIFAAHATLNITKYGPY